MTTWLALPAYDEMPRLPRLLARWREVLAWLDEDHRVVVVDDGSRDGTGEFLAEEAAAGRVEVLTHAVNQGLGATLRDGLRHVAGHAAGEDAVVVMDADDTHPPELFPVMLARLRSSGCDVVIASRFRRGARIEGLSRLRRATGTGASLLFRAVHRVPNVRDYTCGYRVYRAARLQQAFDRLGERFVERAGFDCSAEVLLKLARLGARFEEVALPLDYRAKAGHSHMRVVQTVLRTLRLLALRG